MISINQQRWRVVVAAIVKDEEIYIEDWVNYHLSIGVEHFIIFDNGSSASPSRLLSKYINHGVITLISWPVRAGQIDAYNYAVKVFGPLSEWIGFLDIDEFVVLEYHSSLKNFFESVGADQILLPWRNYGHNGHLQKPGGASLDNFVFSNKASKEEIVQCKHFVRPEVVQRTTAHFSFTKSQNTRAADGAACRELHFLKGPSYKGAYINHYATRSYVENQERMLKGQVSGSAHKRVIPFQGTASSQDENLQEDRRIHHFREGMFNEARRWRDVSDRPHRFGLLQPRDVLFSQNPVMFYAAKSVGNYLLGEVDVKPASRYNFISYRSGSEVDVSSWLPDYSSRSLAFRANQDRDGRHFSGTVHYGDFMRRFDFCPAKYEYDHAGGEFSYVSSPQKSLFVYLDIANESDASISVRNQSNGTELIQEHLPVGRHIVLLYSPEYQRSAQDIQFIIDGSAVIREAIIGEMP